MIIIEFLAVLFSVISVVYATKKSILTWIYGLLGIAFYELIFWNQHLWAAWGLQIIFAIQCIIGIVFWKSDDKINRLSKFKINRGLFLLACVILTEFLYRFLSNYTNNPMPFLDALATSLSIGAATLMIMKKKETWIYWIIADIVYIILFASQHLWLSSSLYFVLTLISINGYNKWKN